MEGVKLFDESLVGGAMGCEEWLYPYPYPYPYPCP